jgi:hypothetical protein
MGFSWLRIESNGEFFKEYPAPWSYDDPAYQKVIILC